MNIMVTGGSGFVGKHLINLLREEGHEVFNYSIQDGYNILNYEQLRTTLDIMRPDKIFHLAGQAYVPESFTNPHRAFEVNTIGSLNLLEAVRNLGIKTKVLLCGTSEEYGDAHDKKKVTETTLPVPKSPYAVSKWAMEQLGRIYSDEYGLHVVTTRAYNHTGPGRGEMYAESAFAKQIIEVERGERETVEHGNLNAVRNYTDVRDVVKAYDKAIDLPPGTYNVCSDQNVKIKEVLDALIKASTADVKTYENPALFRPGDFSFNEPSSAKLRKLTDWKPEIKLEKTMSDLLQDWRDRLR